MKKIREYIDAQKQKAQFEKESQIKSDFNVAERGGYLWLTHNGIAFIKVASVSNAGEVASALNSARDCALEFERL